MAKEKKIGVRFSYVGKKLYCYISYKKKTNRFKYYLQEYNELDREQEHVLRCISYLEKKEGKVVNKGLSSLVHNMGAGLSTSYSFSPNYYYGDILTYNQYRVLASHCTEDYVWFKELDSFLNTTNIPSNELKEVGLFKKDVFNLLSEKDQLELSLLIYTYFFEQHNDKRLVDWYLFTNENCEELFEFINSESKRISKGLAYKIISKKFSKTEVTTFINEELKKLDEFTLHSTYS